MAHATPLQYELFTHERAPSNIERLLARASELIDSVILTDVDEDDADVTNALANATCAVVEQWHASYGDTADFADIGVNGKISLGELTLEGSVSSSQLPPRAERILKAHGLLYRGVDVL